MIASNFWSLIRYLTFAFVTLAIFTSSAWANNNHSAEHSEEHEEVSAKDVVHALDGKNEAEPELRADILDENTKKKGPELLERAQFANKMKNYKAAEKFYMEALTYGLTVTQRKTLLLELGKMYDDMGESSKLAIVYEKFLEKYPNDSARPQILIRLGRLYRDMGGFNIAINRFYEVLNSSLKITEKDLPVYKHLTLKAQLEIADTYFIKKDNENAIKLFRRLLQQELSDDERLRVEFKLAYACYNTKQYEDTIKLLDKLLKENPNSTLAPESHYLLASTYDQLNRTDKAIEETFKLIRHEDAKNPDEGLWQFWKKKTANHLANNFYDQQEYISALKIYQAMVNFSKEPEWQWPVVYQIGRCFERLQRFGRAKQAYEIIVKEEEWKDLDFTMTETLQSIKETAQWRLQHIQWLQKTKSDVQELLNQPQKSEEESTPSNKRKAA